MNLHKYNTKFQPIIKSSFAIRVKNVLDGPNSGQVPYTLPGLYVSFSTMNTKL